MRYLVKGFTRSWRVRMQVDPTHTLAFPGALDEGTERRTRTRGVVPE